MAGNSTSRPTEYLAYNPVYWPFCIIAAAIIVMGTIVVDSLSVVVLC